MANRRIIINRDKCDQCGTCIAMCLQNAIEMADNPPIINESLCQACLACIQICPMGAMELSMIANKK